MMMMMMMMMMIVTTSHLQANVSNDNFSSIIWNSCKVQLNFSGSNTDGSFTTAVLNSFLSSLEKNQ